MLRFSTAAAVAALISLPITLTAQSREVSLAAGWLQPAGEDFAETSGGPGVDAAVRFEVAERFQLGGGVHWSRHGVDFAADDYDVIGLFIEPRLLLGMEGAGAQPFLAARVAWLRESITESVDRAATGVGFGLLAGVSVPVSDGVALELAAGGYLLSFGDFHADGTQLALSGGSGQAYAARLGLGFAF